MITFGGIELTNPRPITRSYDIFASVKKTVTRKYSVQVSSTINRKWRIEFTCPTLADLETIYGTVGNQDLVIDGTTYPNCVIIERGDSQEHELLTEFPGVVTIVQNTFTGSSGASPTERVINGGFEQGDLTGWSANYPGLISVVEAAARSGTYGCQIKPSALDPHDDLYITQGINLTDCTSLTFYVKSTASAHVQMEYYLGAIQVGTRDLTAGSWVKETIDVTSYSGTTILKINAHGMIDGEVYIDDVSCVFSP